MNKSMVLNSNYKMSDFNSMTGEVFATRLGYTIRDLQTQVRRWELGSIEKDKPVETDLVKSVILKVAEIKRENSKEKVTKAQQLHFLLFGETAPIPSESKSPTADIQIFQEEKVKKVSNLKEMEKSFKKTDFGFIEAFIEWLASAAPLAIICFAFLSFFGTGIFNAVFYSKFLGWVMGIIIAFIQDGARFALFLASAKMFKNDKLVLGGISAFVSLCLVIFEIYESSAVAQSWNIEKQAQIAITFSFVVLLGFFLELVMALIIHPFKRN